MYGKKISQWFERLAVCSLAAVVSLGSANAVAQTVDLADRPMFSVNVVPGNLMLALSVEWPTANTPAYLSTDAFTITSKYLGYFDANKCYRYVYNAADATQSYFTPQGAVSASGGCTSTTTTHQWSGNYLNWAAMQSLDIFRWVLTGGDRVVDSTTETILEKTRESGQASTTVFPSKTLTTNVAAVSPFTGSSLLSDGRTQGTFVRFAASDPSVSCTVNIDTSRSSTISCTPFGGTAMTCATGNNVPAQGATATCAPATPPTGQTMSCSVTRSDNNGGNRYSYSCAVTGPGVSPAAGACVPANITYANAAATTSCTSTGTDNADYTGSGTIVAGRNYRAQIRVKVCDSAIGLESNCKQYGTAYKPEGLMQEYSMQLRFGAMGYLNDGSGTRDGGVLRAQIGSIGPLRPVPGSASVTNTTAEWNSTTGQLVSNPDSAAATQTTNDATTAGYAVTVNNSGVINYLNKFGKIVTGAYKSYDPVGEMYYAATRYFRNLGNVPSYTSLSGAGSQATLAQWIDGFPVITGWQDPIQYTCQKNFILGIGDVNTWNDKNVPGNSMGNNSEPAVPAEVTADATVNATTANNMVGQLEGINGMGTYTSGRNNSYYMAGLAYDAHTRDIRPGNALPGTQTISTYWMDVREGQTYLSKNQYWLAAKYGGFDVPSGFDPYAATNGTGTIPATAWTKTGQTVGADSRPNNYFIASDPQAMATGLRAAFARIASESAAASTTSFSTTTAKVTRTGTASYATEYNPRDWTGDVEASEITFNDYGVPVLTTRWSAASLLDAASPGNRKIVTCCTAAGAAIPFRASDLSGNVLNARTNYASFTSIPGVTITQTAANYVDYLRGVRTLEQSNTDGGYRTRNSVLGDIVGSRANPVGKPAFPYADLFNPGYGTFKATYETRKTVVYVGANDGMLHAFGGTLPVSGSCPSGGSCGDELFAFIPSFVYGANNTIAADRGLASLGKPNFDHRYLVDGTAQNYDVDFFNTPSPTATAPDWRTMLIGGLGKGGNGYYALDVTNPSTWTSESNVAGKFLWEFTDSRMGLTYGEPLVVKTRKYGWTVVLPSGYNNSDGKGYIFLVNPRTGALLEAIATPEGSTTTPLNLAHINAYVPSFRDFTADSVYAGDLQGNVWRFDLTGTGTLPAPTKIATLTDTSGNVQPVTTRVLVELDPSSNKRYVVVATGRLMADSDISSTQRQTIYVIADGTSGAGEFYTAARLPTGASFPVGRSQLNNNSNPLTGIGSTPTRVMGWYVDLNSSATAPAERVNTDMTANQGSILVAVNQPDGNACNGGGNGRLMGLRLSDGRTVLTQENTTTNSTELVASRSVSGVITNLSFLTVGGQTRAYYGTSNPSSGTSTGTGTGTVDPTTTRCGSSTNGRMDCNELDTGGGVVRRLNWREVQTAN